MRFFINKIKNREKYTLYILNIACFLAFSSISASDIQANSDDTLPQYRNLIYDLQQGGYVIYFRHGKTERKKIDKNQVDLQNCAEQRNLSPEGRAQMKTIGQALRTLKIKIDKVMTSQFCRSIDSGKFLNGPLVITKELNFSLRHDRKTTTQLASSLRLLLGTTPPIGTNTILVGHTGNLKEATDIWPQPDGVAHIFQPHRDGSFEYIAKIMPAVWQQLSMIKYIK